MRTKVTSRLPRNWKAIPRHGELIKHAADVTIRGSQLRLKVLVFRTGKDMAQFWSGALGLAKLSPKKGNAALGAVNKLSSTVFGPPGHEHPIRREVDAGYYAVMGLVSGIGTSPEVVAHESVHAAFAFADRLGVKNPYIDPNQGEESVCYPAGKITDAVMRWLIDVGEFNFSEADARVG